MGTKLNALQLYTMLLVFLLGTSIIFGTPKVVPDTWLVDLLTVLPAGMMLILYFYMAKAGRNKSLYALLEKAWGRYIGKAIALCYAVYFLYLASRNVRDMLELVMTSLLRATPSQLLVTLFVLLVAYAAAGGIAGIGRLSVLIAGMVLFFFLTLAVLLIISGSVDMQRLLPVLSEGVWPVTHTVLKSTTWFPYGEIIVFLAFRSKLGTSKQIGRAWLASLLSAAAILTFADLLQTTTLGMINMKYSVFALLDAARLINIAHFITRMDALVAFIIIFGVLLKCAIFLYAGANGAAYLFRRRLRRFHLPLALLIGAFSLMISRNYAEHVDEGLNYVMYCLHIPLQLAVPLATFILIRIRSRKEAVNEPL